MAVKIQVDILTIGNASYDLVFSVPRYPNADEKMDALAFTECGGGPAANAAVTAARLGFTAAFCGYLGNDIYGEKHFQEMIRENVFTDLIARGRETTPLSAIFVQPDGKRSLVNYRKNKQYLPRGSINFSCIQPKVILFDGHEPFISEGMLEFARTNAVPTILDAGSVHEGTKRLADKVDYLICSKKFAVDFAGTVNIGQALDKLCQISPHVVITLGDRGLVWKYNDNTEEMPAFKVNAVDTTGAGDVFHGAFACCKVKNMPWEDSLRFASAAAALSCTKTGGRLGIPVYEEVVELLNRKVNH